MFWIILGLLAFLGLYLETKPAENIEYMRLAKDVTPPYIDGIMDYYIKDINTFTGKYIEKRKWKDGKQLCFSMTYYEKYENKPLAISRTDGPAYVIYKNQKIIKEKYIINSVELTKEEFFALTDTQEVKPVI